MQNEDRTPENSHQSLGRTMVFLTWIGALAVLALLMSNWLDKQRNPNQQIQIATAAGGQTQVILQRNKYGHYVSNGFINGKPAVFFLDTGATDVGIPADIADNYGLKRGPGMQVSTANGIITVFSTRLDSVRLGPLQAYDVRANINPYMQGEEILLGMSFLKHLDIIQRGNELLLSIPISESIDNESK